MKIRNPDKWLLVAVVVIGTLVARSCSAGGYYNSDGFTNHGSDGIDYFHGSDGNNGWQNKGGGGSFYHDDRKNCFTNDTSVGSFTHCHDY